MRQPSDGIESVTLSVAGHEPVTMSGEQFARLPETVAKGLRAGKGETTMATATKPKAAKPEQLTAEAAYQQAGEMFEACIEQHDQSQAERGSLDAQKVSLLDFMARHGISVVKGRDGAKVVLGRNIKVTPKDPSKTPKTEQLAMDLPTPVKPTVAQVRLAVKEGTLTKEQAKALLVETDKGPKLIVTWPKDE